MSVHVQRSRLRRIWHIVWVSLLALVALTVVTALGLFYSRWGQDRIRQVLEARLMESIQGSVSIRALDIGLGGGVSARDIEIRDTRDRPVLALDSADMDVSMRSLASGKLIIPSLEIAGARVHGRVRDGKLDLAEVFESEEEAGEGGMPVAIESLAIRDSHFELEMEDGERITLANLELEGSSHITGFNTAIFIKSGQAHWVEGDIGLQLAGDLYIDPNLQIARQVAFAARDSTVQIQTVTNDLRAGRTEAAGHVRLAASDIALACERGRDIASVLARICDELMARRVPDVLISAAVSHEADDYPWYVNAWVEGQSQHVRVGADASLFIRTEGTEQPSLYGSVSGSLRVEPQGDEAPTIITLEAYAAGNRVVARVDARTPVGRGQGRLRAHLPDELWDELWIDELMAQASISELAVLTGGVASGAIPSLEVRASGAWNALDTHVAADVEDLTIAGTTGSPVRVGKLQLELDASGVRVEDLPDKGSVWLAASNIEREDQHVGELALRSDFSNRGNRWDVELDVRQAMVVDRAHARLGITRRKDRMRIGLHAYDMDIDTLRWRGRGGTVTIDGDGRIGIQDVVARSSAGQLSVDGTIGSRRPQNDQFVIGMTGVRLAELSDLLDRPLQGSADAEWRLQRGRRHWLIRGNMDFQRVAWDPRLPAITGKFNIDLGNDRLAVDVDATTAPRNEQFALELATSLPRDPFDLEGWRALELSQVQTMRVSASSVDLGLLDQFAGDAREPPISGMLDASVELRPDSRTLAIDLRGRNLALPVDGKRYRPFDVQVSGTWNSAGLAGQMSMAHMQKAVFVLDYSLGADLAVLWSHLDDAPMDYVQSRPLRADLRIDRFDLARLEMAAPEMLASADIDTLAGHVSALVEVRGTVAKPTVSLRDGKITGLCVDDIRLREVSLAGELDTTHASASVTAVHPNGGSFQANGRYGWQAPVAMSIDVTARDFNLATLRLLATDPTDPLAAIGGRLNADLHIGGKPLAPQIRGSATIRDGELWVQGSSRYIHDMDVSLAFDPDRILIEDISARVDEGTVRASGKVDLEHYAPRSFEATLESRDVAIFTAKYTARIRTSATIKGDYNENDGVSATVRLTRSQVELDELERELQSLEELEDVIYVNEPARTEAQSSSAPWPLIRVRVIARRGIQVKAEDIEAVIAPKPYIEATFTSGTLTAVDGGIEAVRGRIMLFNHNYQVNYANLEFDGPPTNPSVNLELMGEFPDTKVFVQVSGTVQEPEATLRSDPPADETTILAIMLGQDPQGIEEQITGAAGKLADIGRGGPSKELLATGAIGAGALLAGRVLTRLPVRIDVVQTHSDGITLGRWVTRELLLGYRYRATPEERENSNEATLRWRFRRNWRLEGHYGDKDVGALDLLWQHSF